jgi:excisionase family DNA binding protein
MKLAATQGCGLLLLEGERSMNELSATMSEAEFAKAVGLSRVTLWRMRQKGELPHYKLGKRVLYGKHHVEAFLRAHELLASTAERE